MGKKEDKRERERLAREQQAATQQLNQFIAQNSQMSPYQRLREDMLMNDLNYFNQGVPDYSKGPMGMMFADAASREGQARRQLERSGTGLIQMGTGGNPGMVAAIRENQANRFGENAALSYTDALNQRRAEALGSVVPMASARNQFVGNVGGLMGNRLQLSNQAYANRSISTPWWQIALSGLQNGAQAKVQMGCVTFDTPILTPEGYVPAGDIKEGGLVVGIQHGQKISVPVVRARVSEQDTVKVTTERGHTIQCSTSHRFLREDGREVFVSEMTAGDELLTLEGTDSIKSIVPTGRAQVVIHKLGSWSGNSGIITNGILSMDDYAVSAVGG